MARLSLLALVAAVGQRTWSKALSQGLSEEQALLLLSQAETRTLRRDQHALITPSAPQT